MSQVNSVKDLRNKHAKCLVQNRGQTPLIDIKRSSYPRPRTTPVPAGSEFKKRSRSGSGRILTEIQPIWI